MASDPSKTEKATPKRRQKAREEGSVLRVQDLDATIMLWGNLFLFLALGGSTMTLMLELMRHLLGLTAASDLLRLDNLHALGMDLFVRLLKILLPFLGATFFLAVATQLVQHGFHLNFKVLQPKFEKLNPVPGFKRLFGGRAAVDLLKSVAKFLVVAGVAWLVISPRLGGILGTMKRPLTTDIEFFKDTILVLYRNLMLIFLALAAADFLYQRHTFEEGLKMTKQEVKDEAKEAEGNPEIKGRQKSIMFAAAMRRIITQVPKASVVITNPTHFAVALRYDASTAAPVVVAKGVDHLALKIRERATQSGVAIVENPPLARAIYHSVDLDQPIPGELYQAVAQVLAYVYRLRGAA